MALGQLRSQVITTIGDLSVPSSTVSVYSGALASALLGVTGPVAISTLSGNAVAVTIISGSAAAAAGGSSNINVVQVAGAVVPASGTQGDAVANTSSGTLPTQTFGYGWNLATSAWDRLAMFAASGAGSTTTHSLLATALFGVDPGGNRLDSVSADAGTDTRADNLFGILSQSHNYVYNGSTWTRSRAALGTTGIPSVNIEGTRSTYSASVAQTAFSAASGTDVFLLNGSATNISRIVRAEVSFTALAPTTIAMSWTKRSAVTTAGTSTNPTAVKHDTSSAAASAVVTAYTNTAGQAPGAILGAVRTAVLTATLASSGVTAPWVEDFSAHNEQSPNLRGTSEVWALTISSGSVTVGASNISVNLTWTEAAA